MKKRKFCAAAYFAFSLMLLCAEPMGNMPNAMLAGWLVVVIGNLLVSSIIVKNQFKQVLK